MTTHIRSSSADRPGSFPLWAVFVLIAAVIVLAGCGEEDRDDPYVDLFPGADAVEGVLEAGEIVRYMEETLYDYLDGGAELYFDYDIAAVAAREYRLPEDSGIEVSIYDMGTPANAFGIFSIFNYAGADRVDVGDGAVRTPATLDFWKGKYYCKILAFGGSDRTDVAMEELAEDIAARIGEGGSPPPLLDLLPGDGRKPGSEKYFRGHLGLNNVRYVDSKNVFNLGEDTEGVAALYETGESEYMGYVIAYTDHQTAETAYEAYVTYLMAKAQEDSHNGIKVFILDSGAAEAVALRDRHIAGIWDAPPGVHTDFIEGVFASRARRK